MEGLLSVVPQNMWGCGLRIDYGKSICLHVRGTNTTHAPQGFTVHLSGHTHTRLQIEPMITDDRTHSQNVAVYRVQDRGPWQNL